MKKSFFAVFTATLLSFFLLPTLAFAQADSIDVFAEDKPNHSLEISIGPRLVLGISRYQSFDFIIQGNFRNVVNFGFGPALNESYSEVNGRKPRFAGFAEFDPLALVLTDEIKFRPKVIMGARKANKIQPYVGVMLKVTTEMLDFEFGSQIPLLQDRFGGPHWRHSALTVSITYLLVKL